MVKTVKVNELTKRIAAPPQLYWLTATQPAELQCCRSYTNRSAQVGLSNGAIFVKKYSTAAATRFLVGLCKTAVSSLFFKQVVLCSYYNIIHNISQYNLFSMNTKRVNAYPYFRLYRQLLVCGAAGAARFARRAHRRPKIKPNGASEHGRNWQTQI